MQAKLDAVSEGRPASTWASLVLLGDGNTRPFPEQHHDYLSRTRVRAASIGVMALVLLAIALRRAARARRSASTL
jgi:hypothetical protein